MQKIDAIVLGRRDTLARWTENDPIPMAGELVIATDVSRMKLGDGKRRFTELPFIGTDGRGLEFAVDGDLLKIRLEGEKKWTEIIAKGPPGKAPTIEIDEETENWKIDGVDTGKPSRGKEGAKGEATKLTISEDGYAVLDGVRTGTLMRAHPTELVTYINGVKHNWSVGVVNDEVVLVVKEAKNG